MATNKDSLIQFRIKKDIKETFKRKADERYLTTSVLLNSFINKYNKDTSDTILFLFGK